MKFLLGIVVFCSLIQVSLAQSTQRVPIDEGHLKFRYSSQDGEFQLECSHKRIRDLPDWEVICKNEVGIRKVFAAHIVLNKGRRLNNEVKPSRWYELLYWVTDRKAQNAPRFHSSSLILQASDESEINQFQLHQGVENDYASLILDLKTN